ncbi:MAG: hypothetical protein M3R35_02800 [Candidatus Eremiobacteraeota bacterium]|nr:hypothetical protein [Candidatus Eremiobacteraeota bacterium]
MQNKATECKTPKEIIEPEDSHQLLDIKSVTQDEIIDAGMLQLVGHTGR